MWTALDWTLSFSSRSTNGANPWRSHSIALPTRSWLVMAIVGYPLSVCMQANKPSIPPTKT